MNKRLHTRLALIIIGIAAGIVLISTISVILTTHYHFSLYQAQAGMTHELPELNYHLEQAMMQTIIWTCLVAIVLAVFLGFYVAKRISAPLVHMTRVAERMTDGEWSTRVDIKGKDELADLGASLNTLAEQLQQHEQLRVTMTEDIAHELRTPLATLKSHMRALEDGIWEPTPERIHSCYEEIERLTQLVAELEDLTHVESPGFQLKRKEESLAAIIERGEELVAAAYREKNVHLRCSVSPYIQVFVDHDRMIQVLVNLLSNALKFTPEYGEVRIEGSEDSGHVWIRVQDTGTGIPQEDLPYVFERFYRADKSRNRKTGGSGLGLTIVKELVAAHGGEISAENREGAAFTIRLPKRQ
ncbi:signal transduction histidine kinase [Cohnella sp. SGD-V74]|uniref:sensor histidine kinase n=1 Tax=unclassified Cohnella TaxID=2636738 RepID=UPI000B8C6206|nr:MULTISPECIES: ATP-binding protein [unclassified Cohnella]PRX58825.1 signal transduction histidine kinase [Cohnella sp. SGD-V74]